MQRAHNDMADGRISMPLGEIYNASKFALEAYTQCLKYELASKGIEIVLVEPGPFGTGLIASGQAEENTTALEENADLSEMKPQMMEGFSQFVSGPDAPDPKWVTDAYVDLIEMEHGTRPTRTTVGLDYGAKQINELTQPIQDDCIRNMGFDFMLETKTE